MKPLYTQLLSREERAAGMRMGAVMKFAEHGIRVDEIDGVMKSAAVNISPGGAAKAVAAIALLTGIPLGVAAHAIGKRLTEQRTQEEELKHKIDFYQEATRGLETGLAGAPGLST